ncbi:PLDc N-terminal domain-containing protein [Actinoplanes sp. NPDC049802]|uniref:PLDc N-terminal domain-containing protein n=1 Tax=Actinoplanes sp. NPDC049802 TaxID=3154742 RepID=UPI0033CC0392
MTYAAADGGPTLAAVLPLIVLGLGLVGYCLYDIVHNDVRYLPKWAWALICVISIPLGALIYLFVGRRPR